MPPRAPERIRREDRTETLRATSKDTGVPCSTRILVWTMSARLQIQQAVSRALATLDIEVPPDAVHLERPARREHGDWSTNIALAHAKKLGRPPRELASALVEALEKDPPPHLAAVELAGPGFVNLRLGPGWLQDTLVEVVTEGEEGYARPDLGHGERVQVEFISANPTGPLHVGNGWWGSYGDALARVMTRSGWRVEREYYVNDTGSQIRTLGASLLARRRGEEVEEGGYQGEYLADIARDYEGPDDPADPDALEAAGKFASDRILTQIRATLESLGIIFDSWYSQASVEESGAVAETIALFRERGLVYESEGATWLKSSELGDSRDRVLIKSNGDITYLGGDLAYHRDKFLVRGFDRVIDVFGADHHGQVASLKAGISAMGIDPDRLEVKLGQMVSILEGEQAGKMSKRAGNFIALDALVLDIGADATRLLSLLSSLDQASAFDIKVVRSQSMENPVYYVQYAYARISSISRVAKERGIERRPIGEVDLSVFESERELELLRCLEELPDIIAEAARDRAPHKVTAWVRRLAGDFHGFYHDCPVLADDVGDATRQARLWLVEAARVGTSVGLGVLGVSAPETM
jgi:arginyl-tRNA synthetase